VLANPPERKDAVINGASRQHGVYGRDAIIHGNLAPFGDQALMRR